MRAVLALALVALALMLWGMAAGSPDYGTTVQGSGLCEHADYQGC